MEKIQVVIVGYGNIGSFAVQAVQAAADMDLVGIICPEADTISVPEVSAVKELSELGAKKIDVALMCIPTRLVDRVASVYLEQGIHTVDPYDVHDGVWEHLQCMEAAAKKGNACAIISAGWDPGADSIVRGLMEACAPRGITHTNFGPGMSMGHSVAAKAVPGVADAMSITVPLGEGIHRRMVYVQLEDGTSLDAVSQAIKQDPYFAHDETHVIAVDSVKDYIDRGHAGHIVRKGVSGTTDNQHFSFRVDINNPAMTSQVMVCCARAAMKQPVGAYTMIEVPIMNLLIGSRKELIQRHV